MIDIPSAAKRVFEIMKTTSLKFLEIWGGVQRILWAKTNIFLSQEQSLGWEGRFP